MKSPLILFIILNIFMFSLLGLGFFEGWVSLILLDDAFHLIKFIFLFFLVGLILCIHKLVILNYNYNNAQNRVISGFALTYLPKIIYKEKLNPKVNRQLLASIFSSNIYSYISIVKKIAGFLVLLGLIGTVFGVIYAFTGFDISNIVSVESLGPASATMIKGMKIAFYTTLVGSVLNLWLTVCYHILERFTLQYISFVIILGEEYAKF